MRITEHEKNTIIEAVKAIDPDAKVWLFGSRVDQKYTPILLDIIKSVDKYCEKYLVDGA